MAGRQGAEREGMTEGRAMRRVAAIWPLAILFGMLSIIAWDALNRRARDHVFARDIRAQ